MKTKLFYLIGALFLLTGMTFCSNTSNSHELNTEKEMDFASLLGKNIDSDEVKQLLSTLGTKEIESSAKFPHWMFTQDGVEIVVTTENKIHAIFLVKKSYIYKKTYSGFIPYGIKMSDTRANIVKNLGEGKLKSSFGVRLEYRDKNLQVDFDTDDANDLNAPIESIQFRTWEK